MQRLTRWGNSTGLRLPASVVEAAGLEPGDYVYVRLLDTGDIRVRPVKNVQPAELEHLAFSEASAATALGTLRAMLAERLPRTLSNIVLVDEGEAPLTDLGDLEVNEKPDAPWTSSTCRCTGCWSVTRWGASGMSAMRKRNGSAPLHATARL